MPIVTESSREIPKCELPPEQEYSMKSPVRLKLCFCLFFNLQVQWKKMTRFPFPFKGGWGNPSAAPLYFESGKSIWIQESTLQVIAYNYSLQRWSHGIFQQVGWTEVNQWTHFCSATVPSLYKFQSMYGQLERRFPLLWKYFILLPVVSIRMCTFKYTLRNSKAWELFPNVWL